MIRIYTTPSCSSCRKAKEYLKSHGIPYQERNILNVPISRQEIYKMLANSYNGFEDIISERSNVFKEYGVNIYDMKVKELVDFIIAHPSILKRPIILTDWDLQVGYDKEEMSLFLPKELRGEYCDGKDCGEESCPYNKAIEKAVENEIKDVDIKK